MKIYFITWITDAFQMSEDFMYCLHLLKLYLPDNIDLHIEKISNNDVPDVSKVLNVLVGSSCDSVLVSPEPRFITTRDSFQSMVELLSKHQELECILPVTAGYLSNNHIAGFPYFTLRGFEKFSTSMKKNRPPFTEVRPGHSDFFLIRSNYLEKLPVHLPVNEIPGTVLPSQIKATFHAYSHSFSEYYSEQRDNLLILLPRNISSLLDIGCARGNFGKMVKDRDRCRVVGIELNTYEAQEAKKWLDRVIEGDFLETAIGESFDSITCFDVIEHIRSPHDFLLKARTLLNDKGYLLLSVPNIGHWPVIEDLLAGRWDYAPAGILDVTHLRFFTERSIRSLLKDTGFSVVSLEKQFTHVPAHIEDGLKSLQKHSLEIDHDSLSCSGYYILAQK